MSAAPEGRHAELASRFQARARELEEKRDARKRALVEQQDPGESVAAFLAGFSSTSVGACIAPVIRRARAGNPCIGGIVCLACGAAQKSRSASTRLVLTQRPVRSWSC